MPRARIALLGASGHTGRLVAGALDRRGIPFLAVARDEARLRAATAGLTSTVERRRLDVTAAPDIGDLLGDVDVVLDATGRSPSERRALVAAAVTQGVGYLAMSGELPFAAWLHDHQAARAQAAGVTLVPGAGLAGALGDLLVALAGEGADGPCDVHVAYAVPSGLRGAVSAGARRSMAELVGTPVVAVSHGARRSERVGEARRLAWFPRPVGPRHAAAVPGLEPLSVPQHLPEAGTVRTYLTLSTPASELLQLTGNLARWAPARRALARVLTSAAPSGSGPSAEARASIRWACVAEVATRSTVRRAWASGRDPHATSAELVTELAGHLLDGVPPAGVIAPARVASAGDILDALAARTDLRWGRATSPRPAGWRSD